MAKSKNTEEKYTRFTFKGEEFELTPRQKLFAMEYIRHKFNGSAAAIASGYSDKNANVSAVQVLANINVQRYIEALKQDISTVIGISAFDIAKEYAKIGFSDIRNIFDENGALINVKDIPQDAAANISSIEVFEKIDGEGNVVVGNTKKIRFYDKVSALDKLARMIGADGVTKVANTDTSGVTIVEKESNPANEPID